MLILQRKKDESIVINDNISIGVLRIRGGKIHLGIDAPKEVPIHRREIHERIKRQETATASKPVERERPEPKPARHSEHPIDRREHGRRIPSAMGKPHRNGRHRNGCRPAIQGGRWS